MGHNGWLSLLFRWTYQLRTYRYFTRRWKYIDFVHIQSFPSKKSTQLIRWNDRNRRIPSLSELFAVKGLSKRPARRGNIVGHNRATITGNDPKREGLSYKIIVALPVLTPISDHGPPTSPRPFNVNSMNIPCASHIAYEYQIEVRIPVYSELNSSPSCTSNPTHSFISDLVTQTDTGVAVLRDRNPLNNTRTYLR